MDFHCGATVSTGAIAQFSSEAGQLSREVMRLTHPAMQSHKHDVYAAAVSGQNWVAPLVPSSEGLCIGEHLLGAVGRTGIVMFVYVQFFIQVRD